MTYMYSYVLDMLFVMETRALYFFKLIYARIMAQLSDLAAGVHLHGYFTFSIGRLPNMHFRIFYQQVCKCTVYVSDIHSTLIPK